MKLTSSAAISALCWSARLAAAQIYVYDGPRSEPAEDSPSVLSPIPARMVLAQRAGVEDYHRADLAEEGVLEAINDFGRRTSLYEPTERNRVAHILVDGVAESEVSPQLSSQYRRFDIQLPATLDAIRPVWLDLARQALPSAYTDVSDNKLAKRLEKSPEDILEHAAVFYIASHMDDVERVHKMLADTGKYSITLVFAPSRSELTVHESSSIWGTYAMPNTQSPLRKRSAQRPQAEAPLEVAPTSSFQPVQASSASLSAFASNTTAPLPGILPACFSTLTACEANTNSCMGRGKCFRKYIDQTASDKSPFKNCYTCQCSATKQTASDGKVKTTYWGGPACQKKDISVEFWMLALFSVALVSLVGFAVGSVMDMGNLELPSVIGAGVSGPVKR